MTTREKFFLVWLLLLTGAFGVLFSRTRQASFDELTVQRLNVVEPDGKPRLIIANRPRMAGAIWGGKEYKHSNRDSGGMLFFNDDGTEVGGMTFSNRKQGDSMEAGSSLLFDQYNTDQTLGLIYSQGKDKQGNDKREAGLRVWDQPDKSLLPLLEFSDRLMRAANDAEKAAIRAQMKNLEKDYAGAFTERFYAGKQSGESVVKLNDKQGRPRLVLKVDENGAPSLKFLDENGAVVAQLPQQ